MAKNKRTKNDIAWSKAVKNFKARVKYWQDKGINIEYEIHKPEKVTKKDVEWLNKQTGKVISEEEKSTKRLTISHFKDPFGRTKEEVQKLQDELRNDVYKSLGRAEYKPQAISKEMEQKQRELEELYARREAEMDEQRWADAYYEKEDIEPEIEEPAPVTIEQPKKQRKPSKKKLLEQIAERVRAERGEELTDEDIKKQALDLSTDIMHENPDLWKENVGRQGTRQIRELIEIGMTPEQIKFGLEDGQSLSDLKDNWLSQNQEANYATTEYYIDTDTGEIYGENDPRIYAKDSKGRFATDIETGKLKIKETLQHHIGDSMNASLFDEIKWSNFIGSFLNAHVSHFETINPTDIFEQIKNKVGVNAFLDAMSQLSSEGSNISEPAFWYKEGALQNIEKLEAIASRVEKNTGEELSELRAEIALYRDQFASGDDWLDGFDRVRQQNRALHYKR